MVNGQLTSADLNRQMLAISGEVAAAVAELEAAGDEAPEARAAYEREYFRVYEQEPTGDSVAARDKVARGATVELREAAGRAENRLKRAEAVLRAHMGRLSALQSVASSVREEAKFDRTSGVSA